MRQLKHNLLNPLKKSVAAANSWQKATKIVLLCACCTAFYGCASSGEYASRPHLPQQPISQNPHDTAKLWRAGCFLPRQCRSSSGSRLRIAPVGCLLVLAAAPCESYGHVGFG